MKRIVIKMILGFSNYFKDKDENLYDPIYLLVGRNIIIILFFLAFSILLIFLGKDPFYLIGQLEKKYGLNSKLVILLIYLPSILILRSILPDKEIKKIELEDKELKYFYRLNVITLIVLATILVLLIGLPS